MHLVLLSSLCIILFLNSLLIELGLIKDKRVAQTMLKVDRAHYVPLGCEHPYKELAVPLGISLIPSLPFSSLLSASPSLTSPNKSVHLAYPSNTGFNATISAPHMVRFLTITSSHFAPLLPCFLIIFYIFLFFLLFIYLFLFSTR